MREIKFRAWDKKKREWVDEEYYHLIDLQGNFYSYSLGKLLKEDNIIDLMQFTGLKDKNGVEIYEGDIVRIYLKTLDKDMVGEIRWNNTLACFELSVDKGFWGESDWIKVSDKDREVIGNIYENPDLLTKPKK